MFGARAEVPLIVRTAADRTSKRGAKILTGVSAPWKSQKDRSSMLRGEWRENDAGVCTRLSRKSRHADRPKATPAQPTQP